MIIKSLLDTDLYKLTMGQMAFHRFRGVDTLYRFRCRNPDIDLRPLREQIEREIDSYATLRLSSSEAAYLRGIGLAEDYVTFMSEWAPKREHVTVGTKDDELTISIAGPWEEAIQYEVPLLAIVSELYLRSKRSAATLGEGRKRLAEKVALIRRERNARRGGGFKLCDFGTRRRFSREWHDEILDRLASGLDDCLVGTSNVHFAMTKGLKPLGTMAHEYLQACQALAPDLATFQQYALRLWYEEHGDMLAIALSDVVGFDAFLRDFTPELSRLYTGVRHDSGDPFAWCEKLLAHYRELGIDAKEKTAVFSDSVTFPLAVALAERFGGEIKTVFGIGTNLTNDLGVKPINIVIKMVECDGRPVAKLSDSPGKEMCEDKEYVEQLRKLFFAGQA